MIIEELQNISPENGILKLSDTDSAFEKAYNKFLKNEGRLYDDQELKVLPFASDSNLYKDEWVLKTKSFIRFKDYLSRKKSSLNILDIGSGDGWFASQILREQKHNYYCVDVSIKKLEQGAKLFVIENLYFIYANIFDVKFPRSAFDIIIINSSIHYYSDLRNLMRELFYLLKPYGEIHIIDSKFYEEYEVEQERIRKAKYFDLIGIPFMKEKYFFHTYKSLNIFNHKFLYDPRTFYNKILNIAFGRDSFYPWIRIIK